MRIHISVIPSTQCKLQGFPWVLARVPSLLEAPTPVPASFAGQKSLQLSWAWTDDDPQRLSCRVRLLSYRRTESLLLAFTDPMAQALMIWVQHRTEDPSESES